MELLKKLLPAICLILIGLLGVSVSKCAEANNEKEEAVFNSERLLTEQEQYIADAQGRVTTVKESLVLQAAEFTKIRGIKDEQIAKLQEAVKNAGKGVRAAAVFTAVTRGKVAGRTDSIQFIPAKVIVRSSDTIREMPVYYGKIAAPGITGWVRADADSIHLDSYQLKQDYSVAFTDQKKGLFGKRKKVVQIKALNAGTQVEEVRSIEVPEPKANRGLFFGAGAVVTLILLLL
jgi:hypothetical protein